ncbi:RsiV family protein [Acetobacterium fimetarium]|uniref:RsiV family protein n=1 Tax=Acetobacterium fimetarium TaxID=52691 RepID=UPI00164A1EC3|nr:RsiV family protein [Acetobacterium fimetarium]
MLSIDESQIKTKLTNEFASLNKKDVDLNSVYKLLGADSKYYLTDAGVCVYFNQYEVACYAAGRISVTIPYSRTDLLKPIETMIP